MNFEVKIVEYKLTDLKKDAQDALLLIARRESFPAESSDSLLWGELVEAGLLWVNGHQNYELTPDGRALIRAPDRRKLCVSIIGRN